jgi:purine-binding chemotaxis protein CheW
MHSNLPAITSGDRKQLSGEIQLVSFMLGGEEYGVEVLKVREIIRMPEITKMPNAPHFIDGIISLRGKVLPIVSLRRRFGLPDLEHDLQTRIMIMEIGGKLTGFVVDAVSEVIRIPASEIQPPPPLVGGCVTEQDMINGVFSHENRLLVLIEADRLLNEGQQGMLADY